MPQQPTSVSPRRLDASHPLIAPLSVSTDKPPEDSISWQLWLACQDIAQAALATDYVQGIKSGTLDPNRYGQYTVQDAAYCYGAAADYQTVETRARAAGFADLAAFAQARYVGYQSYNTSFLDTWHIARGDAVVPSEAVKAYIGFEHHVTNELPPIYGIIAMIPCDELWPWLATELTPFATPSNLYAFWITQNADWHGAYRLGNFVDAFFAAHPESYDHDTALHVMRSCMTCEVNFFRSACGQPLLPMPS